MNDATKKNNQIQDSMNAIGTDHPCCFVIKLYMDDMSTVELRPCDPMSNATTQQAKLLKYALLQQSDDLCAGIKANGFLSAFVFCKKN